ncbi:MFS transporter [Pseudomonas sp. RIT-PI-q]|uniref:MFS transporter n=1 Tax=Pseudomonas sp. RIT-PI-q TaxID=1690247 RepID=UPI0006CCFF01|nr:MFS transporter [Pseudomonas sp. RIT-PI-q]KPG95958.1 MFS transporter [Pseudomonas sp. RIT-PI-q]
MDGTHQTIVSGKIDTSPKQIDHRKRAVAVGIGNFMEWFDFAIYGYFAAVIGSLFFPSNAPGVSLLSSLAVFAVGFASRPLGAIILGPIGDKFGRKAVLVITVFGMGICTTIIGLLPSYSAIGAAAPILLVTMRFIQGMMVGGEWSSAGIYIVESAPANRRATAASIITGTAGLAFLFGTFTAALISTNLTEIEVSTWGWRIPFVASIIMTGIALFIRRRLGDTPVYEELAAKRASGNYQPPSASIRRKAFFTAFSMSALFGVSLYYFVTYANNHLTTTVGLPKSTALWLCSAALVCYCIANPIVGRISDAYGRRCLVLGAAALLTVLAYPIFLLLNTGNLIAIFVGLTVLGILVAVTAVIDVVLLVEVFPASIRSTGAALGHNLALATLAGPGPFIAAALIRQTGNPNVPAWYLAIISFACFLALWKLLPETKDTDINKY